MEKSILAQFLKAGFIYKRHLNPTKAGTPQGGSISPILANMTLDGIEKLLMAEYPKRSNNSNKVNFTRYADDCAPRRRLVRRSRISTAML